MSTGYRASIERQKMSRRTTAKSRQASFSEDPIIEWLAWLMDESIALGRGSIGLDGLLGLIPVFGDVAGALISLLIVARALEKGLPRSAVLRMLINVAIDAILGVFPVIGDLFDFTFKANVRNLRIYREALRGEREPVQDWLFIILVLALLMAAIALPVAALVYIVSFTAVQDAG
jgi:hypothetical protein